MLKGRFSKIVAVLLAMILAGQSLCAQDGAFTGFTPYSIFGAGDVLTQGSAFNKGMGGVGIATRNKRFINYLNPAAVTARDSISFMAEMSVFENNRLFGLGNCLMVMYAMATANRQTALFHASAIGLEDRAYLFLGKSGTGKSTHSSLWLKHIEGTELMNDDNPIVRMIDGQLWVYGSPWSGKTPCYRNVKARLGAIVDLSQAPHNKIRRLKGIQAYAALMPAISGKRWDSTLAEGLHEMETLLVRQAPIFHLECLPDADAALTCLHEVQTK